VESEGQADPEVHTVVVEAVGVDGKQYRVELNLNFPSGTRILSFREAVHLRTKAVAENPRF
jgi:hypothetical protein